MIEENITGEDQKFYCQRCKTGYPANVFYQVMGKRWWRICQDCSRVAQRNVPVNDNPPTPLPTINI